MSEKTEQPAEQPADKPTESRRKARPSSHRAVAGGIAVAFGLHFSIILSVVLLDQNQSEAIEENVEEKLAPFEPVELIRLGEKKPKNALPRIANPPPVTVEEDVVNLAKPDPDKVVLEKEEPKKDKKVERVERKDKINDILKGLNNEYRPTNTDTPDGDPDGVPEGTTSDIANKALMNTYGAKVVSHVTRQWSVPSAISADEAKKLAGKVQVYIRLSEDGHIVSYRMSRKSGNGQFDISVERAVKRFMVRFGGQKLPLPADASTKAFVIKKGLTLRRWQYKGR